MSSGECAPGGGLPELSTLSIPHNVSVFVIPGTNASDAAMVACCAPMPVNVIDGCYEWCATSNPKTTLEEFSHCLTISGRDYNRSRITGMSTATSGGQVAGVALTAAQLGMWVLLVSGMLRAVY